MHKIIFKTLRTLHRIFRASNSLNDAATTLGVSVNSIINHLGKTHYINEDKQLTPLTFHAMIHLWPDEHSAEEAWGDAYDQLICSVIVDLNQITMRELHQIILYSHSHNHAAEKMGIGHKTLSVHLSKTNYINQEGEQVPLNFKMMQTQWPDEKSAFQYWARAYDQPMNTASPDLNKISMRNIHRIILSSRTSSEAARKLGVYNTTLSGHLGKTNYITATGLREPLTFEIMKNRWPNEKNAERAWGNAYNQPMSTTAVDLNQKTMRVIHGIILSSNSLVEAAGKLGVHHSTLNAHLGKTNYSNEAGQQLPLTYKIMKIKWPIEQSAFEYWGYAYDQPMNAMSIDLNKKTIRSIHRIILSSHSRAEAAGKLGISHATLNIHLGKTKYFNEEGQQVPLTFKIMKTRWQTEQSAFEYWGDIYDQPMHTGTIDLKQKTMQDLHQAILSSSSPHDASGKLGVRYTTLKLYLSKTNYHNEDGQQIPVTCQIMKTQWPTEQSAIAYWGDAYYQPIVTTNENSASKKRKNYTEAPLKKNKLRFFGPKVPENESEEVYPEWIEVYKELVGFSAS